MKVRLVALLATGALYAAAAGQVTEIGGRENAQLQYITWPTYHLAKVKKLIGAVVDSDPVTLDDKVYRALSDREKLTYCLINGEVDTQNCDPGTGPQIPNPETKIFRAESENGPMENQGWSERQEQFLRRHRAMCVTTLRQMMRGRSHIGDNVEAAIVVSGSYELIPDVLAVYKRKPKDLWPLSICLSLMLDGKYKPFLDSATYRKLYGPKSNAQSYVEGNSANIALIEKRAMAYYHLRIRGKA